jgi:pre-mRNA-processing factor 40
VYPLFARDKRYLELLGNPGSNPIELFWDVVDQLDQELEVRISLIESALEPKGIKFSVELSQDVYMNALKGDSKVERLSEEQVVDIYHHVCAF